MPEIYIIRNNINGKVYVGSTINGRRRRWGKQHRSKLRMNKHHNRHLQRAWNKYGEAAFEYVVIDANVDDGDLALMEQYWLEYYRGTSGVYNCGIVAESPRRYAQHTESTKAKMRNMWNKRKASGYRHPQTGKPHTAETRCKISEGLKRAYKEGRIIPPQLGKSPSTATRKKQSIAMRDNHNTLGYKHSDEAKRNMSAAKQGCAPWNVGIPHSEETKRKISDKAKIQHRDRDALGRYI